MSHRKLVITAQDRPIDVARRDLVAVVNYAEHDIPTGDHSAVRERMLADISTYIDKLIAGEIDDITVKRSEDWR